LARLPDQHLPRPRAGGGGDDRPHALDGPAAGQAAAGEHRRRHRHAVRARRAGPGPPAGGGRPAFRGRPPARRRPGGSQALRAASFVLALMLFTLLYSTVLMWGAAIMNGVIEEKTNRVVEVIVSSLPTSSLFTGKLLGVGAAGLTQFLVWSLTMAAFGLYGAA